MKFRYIRKIENETNIHIYASFFTLGGKLNNIAATSELLRTNNCIPSNVILLFDEVYLRNCDFFFGGDTFGTDESGISHKCMTALMTIGLTKNVLYVINTVPENNTEAGWLMDDLIKCSKCFT